MPRGDRRSLVLWSWVVLALLAAHDVTHVVDDGLDTSPGQLAVVAIPQWLALAGLMTVVIRDVGGHGRTAALLLGISVVVGFAIVHLLPVTPISFWELQPSLVSWVLAWAATAAGAWLAVLARPPLRASVQYS